MHAHHLLTAEQVEGPGGDHLSDAERNACRDVLRWARAYLCRPHQALGRKGPVCPFVAGSLARRCFYLHVERQSPPTDATIEMLAGAMGELFPSLMPVTNTDAQYKAILMLFPGLSDGEFGVLDAVQARLKPSFVSRGYMIGQFHNRPPANPGLWNANFRPLTSDVPMLVIRHMVPSDLPFLLDEQRFATAWADRFGDLASDRQRNDLRHAVDASLYARYEAVWTKASP